MRTIDRKLMRDLVTLRGQAIAIARGKPAVAEKQDSIRTTYAGTLLVSKLSTLDRASSEEFLTWGALHLDGIRLETAPLALAIREVSLSDFYSRLIVREDGTLNVQEIVRKEEPAPAGETAGGTPDNTAETKPPEPSGTPTPVSIRSVTLQGGRIHFTDYFIQQNHSANFLQVAGRIAGRKLEAKNNAFLDPFTFGDPVESPDATKLPVRLAVALLKDRSGEIRLDLPVCGSLDNPKFRVGQVVIRILVNPLVKAATSPFALLGALFGGGEEFSPLEFDYGRDTLDDPGKAKIAMLAKALHERPSLKLYLKRAYRAEKFPKPRNFLGMVKDIPVPEMEKLMFAHLEGTDGDLRLLAQRRAQAVKDSLAATKLVEPQRIFLLEPKTLAPEKIENRRDSRVIFMLK